MEGDEIVLTEEQEKAYLRKTFGTDDRTKIAVKTETPNEEEIKKQNEERQKKVLTTALENNWYTQGLYDEYQIIKGADKVELARKKFVEDHPELGEDAVTVFNDTLGVDEDDEIEETVHETEQVVKKPNLKKKVGAAFVNQLAEGYVNTKFADIINADQRFTQLQEQTARKAANIEAVNTAFTQAPAELEIQVGEREGPANEAGEKPKIPVLFKYKIDPADLEEAKTIFLDDQKLINRKEPVTSEEILANALLYVRGKNQEKMMVEFAETEVAKALDRYERGIKGLLTDDDAGEGGIKDAKMEFLNRKGIKV